MINSIINLIQDSTSINISIKEDFERLSINASSNSLINLKENCVDLLKHQLLNSRDYILDFIISINDNPIHYDLENFQEFWEEYSEISELHITDTECKCELNITIKKHHENNILSVYSLDSLCNYINSLNLTSILSLLAKKKYSYFEIIDESLYINCYSNMFYFYTKGTSINPQFEKNSSKEILDISTQNCSYANRLQLDFEPNNFKFSGSINPQLNNLFEKILIIFSLILIFDISHIKENKIELSLCGKTVQNFIIDYTSVNAVNLNIYYAIFEWVYSKENVVDKLLICRNVLLINLYRKETLDIPCNLLSTIKSNFKIYIQDNYEKYVSSKTTAITTLLDIQKQISELSNNLTDNFFKNITIICTFVFTIIIVKPIGDGKLTNIFTKDVTLISIALTILSIIFLKYTLIDIDSKKNNLYLLQTNINKIYTDILSTETLDEIVTNNEYYLNSKLQLDKKIHDYTILWSLVILLFFLLTLVLGWDHFYYVFNFIYSWIASRFTTSNPCPS
ncbi:hypothetical protein [Clostridium chromiireducens]|uniref:Uncharacterized protein n=1 Tax=Clostridium chromiireducens TaxID=225345 RepID=A0A1V4IE55_9CLOT|nr:hypothetical protein [Clostridium chromiireducens]OPJ58144.1 hypothetical protein CLCHR_40460 [Clostridium chromiireducens]